MWQNDACSANHWRKLQNSWKHAQLIYELSLLLQSIFYAEKVWSDSFVQKVQEIQYASSAAIKKFNQSFYLVSSDIENLIKLKAAVK